MSLMAGGSLNTELAALASSMEGDLLLDYPSRLMYATDASVYREIPMAVSRPLNVQDIRLLIRFASDHGLKQIEKIISLGIYAYIIIPAGIHLPGQAKPKDGVLWKRRAAL